MEETSLTEVVVPRLQSGPTPGAYTIELLLDGELEPLAVVAELRFHAVGPEWEKHINVQGITANWLSSSGYRVLDTVGTDTGPGFIITSTL